MLQVFLKDTALLKHLFFWKLFLLFKFSQVLVESTQEIHTILLNHSDHLIVNLLGILNTKPKHLWKKSKVNANQWQTWHCLQLWFFFCWKYCIVFANFLVIYLNNSYYTNANKLMLFISWVGQVCSLVILCVWVNIIKHHLKQIEWVYLLMKEKNKSKTLVLTLSDSPFWKIIIIKKKSSYCVNNLLTPQGKPTI